METFEEEIIECLNMENLVWISKRIENAWFSDKINSKDFLRLYEQVKEKQAELKLLGE